MIEINAPYTNSLNNNLNRELATAMLLEPSNTIAREQEPQKEKSCRESCFSEVYGLMNQAICRELSVQLSQIRLINAIRGMKK